MEQAVKTLRAYFKSPEWTAACQDEQQPTISDNGVVGNDVLKLDTKVNLALEFEGKFNEFARTYMQYRKDNDMQPAIYAEMTAGLEGKSKMN